MESFLIILTGCAELVLPFLLIWQWNKRTKGRYMPFIAGFLLYMFISLIRAPLRAGLPQDNAFLYYFGQGTISALLEQSVKVAAFLYLLKNYDRREDAVAYGIGHAALELLGSGVNSFGMLAAPGEEQTLSFGIYWVLKETFIQIPGLAFHIGLTVILFYAIREGRLKVLLPAAYGIHILSHLLRGFLPMTADVLVQALLCAGIAYFAVKCYRELPEYWGE